MDHDVTVIEEFDAHRDRLRAVAARVLGSAAEADDAVQEAWLRLSRAEGDIDNLGGWLTTVVSRVALDMLRARGRRERPTAEGPAVVPSPEDDAVLADSVGAALVVVLESLAPAERLAFVLHDSFGVGFDELGAILGRSPAAAKQLAHRARRKVQGAEPGGDVDPTRQREVVAAFLAAARAGDFDALVALLHPDVDLVADGAVVATGSPPRVEGATAVAGMFSGRALGARVALVDGAPGLAWAVGEHLKVVWDVAVVDGRIAHLDMLGDAETLTTLDLTFLED